jgi:DNA-binding NarL/FixJ family response regulator
LATVLVAGRHAGTRRGLTALLRPMPQVAAVREVEDAPTLLAFCRAAACDVVVLDAALPAYSEQPLVTLILQTRPRTPVIVHSFSLDYDLIQQCLRLGARGYLAAEDLGDEIAPAVRAVLAGKTYLSQTVRALLRDAGTDPT